MSHVHASRISYKALINLVHFPAAFSFLPGRRAQRQSDPPCILPVLPICGTYALSQDSRKSPLPALARSTSGRVLSGLQCPFPLESYAVVTWIRFFVVKAVLKDIIRDAFRKGFTGKRAFCYYKVFAACAYRFCECHYLITPIISIISRDIILGLGFDIYSA